MELSELAAAQLTPLAAPGSTFQLRSFVDETSALEVALESPAPSRRFIEGIATTACLDTNDVFVTPAALRGAARDLETCTTILENHDFNRSIGRVLESRFDPAHSHLLIRGFISQTEDTVWTKIQEGVLNSFSITWISTDFERVFDDVLGREIIVVHGMRILEVSVVSVPADPDARITNFFERSGKPLPEGALIAGRSGLQIVGGARNHPVAFQSMRAAPRNRPWDAPAAIRRVRRHAGGPKADAIDWEAYRQAFTYVRGDGKKFSDYLLPHHDIVGGRMVSVFAGVKRAAAQLERLDVSDEAKVAMARHLVREYRTVHQIPDDDIPESLLERAGAQPNEGPTE